MAYNATVALDLLKARMDRAGVDTPAPLLSYWSTRLEAAANELTQKGINLVDTAEDNMLVADLAAERILNRDKDTGLPMWLKTQIRQRWFRERPVVEDEV